MLVALVLCTVLPCLLMLGLALLLLRGQWRQYESLERLRLSTENRKLTVPMRLTAYERLALLMERISPESLVVRISSEGLSSAAYEASLLEAVREEWNHNLSQQVYVSEELWDQVRHARGQVSQLLRLCMERVHPEAPASELVNLLLVSLTELPVHPTQSALQLLRREVQGLF